MINFAIGQEGQAGRSVSSETTCFNWRKIRAGEILSAKFLGIQIKQGKDHSDKHNYFSLIFTAIKPNKLNKPVRVFENFFAANFYLAFCFVMEIRQFIHKIQQCKHATQTNHIQGNNIRNNIHCLSVCQKQKKRVAAIEANRTDPQSGDFFLSSKQQSRRIKFLCVILLYKYTGIRE